MVVVAVDSFVVLVLVPSSFSFSLSLSLGFIVWCSARVSVVPGSGPEPGSPLVLWTTPCSCGCSCDCDCDCDAEVVLLLLRPWNSPGSGMAS